MQETIKQWLDHSLKALQATGIIAEVVEPQITVSKRKTHGDYASNVALVLAERNGLESREMATQIVNHLPKQSSLGKVEVAGAGFINFYLKKDVGDSILSIEINEILDLGNRYGCGWVKSVPRVLVEFVSANPTGPLHVGHGRGAAYGETVATLFEAAGYEVEREYYVNDAGRQMDILTTSVWLRYLELGGEELEFPKVGYRGDYIWDIAAEVRRTYEDKLHRPINQVYAELSGDYEDEQRMDGLISNTKQLLGTESHTAVADICIKAMVGNIRADLRSFGICYDRWFSEKELFASGEIEKAIEILKNNGHVYELEGAQWFRSSDFGDEKDRVIVRANGQMTYFASDVAYHLNKFNRGYDFIVNVWGADHHGYVPRLCAAIEALGLDANKMKVLLVQFVSLYRDGAKASMSTRGGQFVTLRELREEVGRDAARFFYVMRKPAQHMDFDINLAKEKSSENPVYYIQYAHARICNVFNELEKRNLDFSPIDNVIEHLTQDHEEALVKQLCKYRQALESAAVGMAPHRLLNFLRELAGEFHSYYNQCQFLVDDNQLRNARLVLVSAVRQVLANGLGLLGVSAPQKM